MLVGLLLFFVGFVVITDAKGIPSLPNDGEILSCDGEYIPGKFEFSHILRSAFIKLRSLTLEMCFVLFKNP